MLMCGRYYFMWKNNQAFHELRRKVEQYALCEYAKEEVFPSQNALVLIEEGDSYRPIIMKWGMGTSNSQLVINAREESVKERVMFRNVYNHRCLIPCNGFYEWVNSTNGKQKILITKKDHELIYLAGFYNRRNEFVILTANSEKEMRSIHERTPLIVTQDKISAFLHKNVNPKVDNDNLRIQQVPIQHKQEQLSLFKDFEV